MVPVMDADSFPASRPDLDLATAQTRRQAAPAVHPENKPSAGQTPPIPVAAVAEKSKPQPPVLNGFDSFVLIGRGGMADVWRARQISLDRTIAIKVLHSDQSTSDEDIDRFQSEARTAAKMSNTGIVQIYDAFYRDSRFCILMEYINGQTIGRVLHDSGFIPEDKSLYIARGIAEALKYAWEKQRLVHCDLKPDNVMMDEDGIIKVTDFGLSRSIYTLAARKSGSEFVFGTPSYMSPEQALNSPDMSVQTDMYALGAMLFHMTTGRRLFEKKSVDEILNAQLSEQDVDPLELNDQLSIGFCDFVERLLAKKPEDRYNSWDEILTALDNVSSGKAIIRRLDLSKAVSTIRRCALRSEPGPSHGKVRILPRENAAAIRNEKVIRKMMRVPPKAADKQPASVAEDRQADHRNWLARLLRTPIARISFTVVVCTLILILAKLGLFLYEPIRIQKEVSEKLAARTPVCFDAIEHNREDVYLQIMAEIDSFLVMPDVGKSPALVRDLTTTRDMLEQKAQEKAWMEMVCFKESNADHTRYLGQSRFKNVAQIWRSYRDGAWREITRPYRTVLAEKLEQEDTSLLPHR